MSEQIQRPDPNSPEWPAYWQSQIDEAQEITDYEIDGKSYARIPYGQECADLAGIAKERPCHDCAVKEGQLHVIGCDVEVCPKCKGQVISCDCGSDEEEDDEEL